MDYSAMVADYRDLREHTADLNERLMRSLAGEDLEASADDLALLDGDAIDRGQLNEMAALCDHALFRRGADGRNAVQKMLEEDPPQEGSAPWRLLRAMARSHFTVFQMQTPIPGVGGRGTDVMRRREILLLDDGLSRTMEPSDMIATRIYSPAEDWWMTASAALPIHSEVLYHLIAETIDGNEPLSESDEQGSSLIEGTPAKADDEDRLTGLDEQDDSDPDDDSESEYDFTLATCITRACLLAGPAENVAYEDLIQPAPALGVTPLQREKKVGRNDPCICGSGKKYKKCCGR